jgi:hypothetical protein
VGLLQVKTSHRIKRRVNHKLPSSGTGALAIALLTTGIVKWPAHNLLARSDAITYVPTLVHARLDGLQLDRILGSILGLSAVAAGILLISGHTHAQSAAVAISAPFILLAFWGFRANGMLLPVIGPMGRLAWWSLVLYALHKARAASGTAGAS